METSLQPPAPSAPALSARDQWFKDEVAPQENVLRAYLRSRYPSVRDVDDVVQESYLRIWKAKAVGRIDSAKSFLFRIATNLCVDVVRKSTRSATTTVGDWSTVEIEHPAATPSESLSAEEKMRIFTEAVATLPARCREAVLLCKFEGLSHADAADRMGVSVRTVDALIRTGMEKIGKRVRREGMLK